MLIGKVVGPLKQKDVGTLYNLFVLLIKYNLLTQSKCQKIFNVIRTSLSFCNFHSGSEFHILLLILHKFGEKTQKLYFIAHLDMYRF